MSKILSLGLGEPSEDVIVTMFMSCTYEKVDLGSSSYQNVSEYTLRCRSLLPTVSIISLSFRVHGIMYCALSDSQVSIMLAGLAKPVTVNI